MCYSEKVAKSENVLQRKAISRRGMAISRRGMATRCRRRTRGAAETERLIGDLLESFGGANGRDTMGIPLLDQDQDPPGVELYTETGRLTRGGGGQPAGSTSLESFHLHPNRFIPGESANPWHFQAFLLEGLMARAPIQLYELNCRTLSLWFTRTQREKERTVLVPGVAAEGRPPAAGATAAAPGPGAPAVDRPPAAAAAAAAAAASSASLWVQNCMAEEEEGRAEGTARNSRICPGRRATSRLHKCRKYGQPKRRETGHTRYGSEHFCSATAGKSVEDWLREMKERDPGRAPD
ncbi:hypothetical protein N1851_020174 [Merluccius polli]|uniref:Uncharacterized protein n=1 Tax=Merluccius polli TaxID=89951 RepID=A0AA47ML88_MERPO|nr:hypothetical protein N1851_020174 [Merluccius polli]